MYPTPKQAVAITNQLSDLRWLYNSALEHRIRAYKGGKPVSYKEQADELPAIKEQFSQFKQIHSQVLQDTLKRLDKAFQNFFRRIKRKEKPGFPRFRSARFFNSMTYPQSGFALLGNRIQLSKIGDVRIKQHRHIPVGADIKTCTIIKEADHWYCSLCFELALKVEKKVVHKMIGIDVGLESFAVLSTGHKIDNPRYYRKSADRLAALQRRYSKSKSNAIKKRIIRFHLKTANQRKDFLHKLSRSLVKNFEVIGYEDLNIKSMITQDRGMNKSINDAAWGKFIAMICYKAESAGSYAIAVDPRNTSQICSGCGAIVKKDISERWHHCNICGTSIHRDINAAKNILSGTGIGIEASPLFLKPPTL